MRVFLYIDQRGRVGAATSFNSTDTKESMAAGLEAEILSVLSFGDSGSSRVPAQLLENLCLLSEPFRTELETTFSKIASACVTPQVMARVHKISEKELYDMIMREH